MPTTKKIYKGRFAPTPSGPAHLGTLFATIASYLQARANNGQWHVRIDDIDPQRTKPNFTKSILHTLENYGLEWDGPIVYQSQHHDRYQNAVDQLLNDNLAYYCCCSRKNIRLLAPMGINGRIYPGTCRHRKNKSPPSPTQQAIRLITPNQIITVNDAIQGQYRLNIAKAIGDFVIYRADGLYAYHLATVVDDATSGFSEIVRGQDLLSSTPQQMYLNRCLGYPNPDYMHLPLLVDQHNKKWSKTNAASAVENMCFTSVLNLLLPILGIHINADILNASHSERWQWVRSQWNPANIASTPQVLTLQ